MDKIIGAFEVSSGHCSISADSSSAQAEIKPVRGIAAHYPVRPQLAGHWNSSGADVL